MKKDYYIGLDIGTDSIGWAVTDLRYGLVKKHGRDFWGTYLFDSAQTAEARRAYRTARRRTARTHQRLMLLQELFAEEIAKVDPTFFLRLKESSLHLSDKDCRLNGRDSLFCDPDFTDKQYHKKFPTVYHLRNALLNAPAEDIRFLYLAVHHLVKNRGHFLFEAQNFSVQETENVIKLFQDINAYFSDNERACFESNQLQAVLSVVKNRNLGVTEKSKQLKSLLIVGKDKQLEAAIKLMAGGKVKLKALYGEGEFGDSDVCFANEKFDEEVLPALEDALGDDVSLVKNLKGIYDWSVLSAILGEEKFLSTAKIKTYEKHKSDLAYLKRYVREQDGTGKLYRSVFRRMDKTKNYAAYVGKDGNRGFGKCTKSDFYDFLKKTLPLDEYIRAEIEKEDFLPKQVSISNGVIPYQVHLAELRQILERAAEKYEFLNRVEDGLTVAEKIISLMTFRIPYYVGPLHSGPFAWAQRREGYERVSITPWNFERAIDKDASENEFIRRMTAKCTYLAGEDVLPAASLLYSEFAFLNELNNLRVNGRALPEVKRLVYDYAKQCKKVTLKGCLKLLKEHGLVEKTADTTIFSGIDGEFQEFHTSLASYVTLKGILGDLVDTDPQLCEEIIERITVVSGDKSRLEQTLKKRYGARLSAEQIKRLKGLNYASWGRLSKRLLTELYSARCCDENGELLSIIEVMRRENKNFMQVLSEYSFNQAIDDYRAEFFAGEKVSYQTVKSLYCSPSVKRAIWRTLELVKEITKIMGGEPKKIFVEMARRDTKEDGKKRKRTVSRKQQIVELYRSIKMEEGDWLREIENTDDTQFNSTRLVLYYRQRGVCMYTGKKISLQEVFDRNVCDIEHIYPQSKIKDDSLDNTILVYKTANMDKSDNYPISEKVQTKMGGFWQQLKKDGFISEKKYARLTRKTPLTQDELTDFINRQLVETRQSTKEVAGLLRKIYEGSEIVYAKAGNADTFKQKFGLIKVREMNDLHHAKDAFVNIVVGNVYNTKFNHDASVYFRKNALDSYNIKKLYDEDIPNAWCVADREEICNTFRKNTCRVVRFTSEGKGTLFKKGQRLAKGEGLIPVKEGGALEDTSKYGGYASATTAYFMLVRGKDKKGKTVLVLEAISIYQHLRCKDNVVEKLKLCEEEGITDCEILVDRIKKNTLVCINGSYAYLRGKTDDYIEVCNANELLLPEEQIAYLKKISNCLRDKKKYFLNYLPVGKDITVEDNCKLYDTFVEKLSLPIYGALSVSKKVGFLKGKREQFENLSLSDQVKILLEVLKCLQCNTETSDITLLGGGKSMGKNRIKKQIQDENVKIILQSPTGYYRKVIDCAQFL